MERRELIELINAELPAIAERLEAGSVEGFDMRSCTTCIGSLLSTDELRAEALRGRFELNKSDPLRELCYPSFSEPRKQKCTISWRQPRVFVMDTDSHERAFRTATQQDAAKAIRAYLDGALHPWEVVIPYDPDFITDKTDP